MKRKVIRLRGKSKIDKSKFGPITIRFVDKFSPSDFVVQIDKENPFDVKPRWSTPDGVVIHAAMTWFARMLKTDKKDAERHMAVSAEAFGVQPGARVPTEEQMTRLTSQIFRILVKNNRKKVCEAMHDLVFWKDFRGGFLYSPNTTTY